MEQQSKFDQIRKEGRLLIEFIRGSNLYNLNNQDSDVDTGGVFISKPEEHLGFLHYHSQESDERHDTTWYEVGEFARLICKSNPTVLEALFVPENKIIGEIHPWMKLFRDNRDKFITKDCFNPFFGYAKSQIEKARGLNKKITNPVYERLTPLDFCYKTNDTGGSEPLKDFLKNSGLKQEYCGLVALDHMHEIYNLYYDFGSHMRDNFQQGLKALLTFTKRTFGKLLLTKFYKPLGYRGIIDSELGNELRLSPIPKNELCICAFSYNASGYSTHCREYKEYKEWEKMRNVKRYESNLKKNYDCYLDSETEFLTEHGWKRASDIKDNELIGAFNEKHEFEFVPIINRFYDDYTGKIYTYENRYLRYSITPNHKLYISKMHRSPKNNFNTAYDPSTANWEFKTVSDYFSESDSFYHQIACLNNKNSDFNISDEYIKLLGYFLSDGTFVFDKNDKDKVIAIRISQVKNSNLMKTMKEYTSHMPELDIREYTFNRKGRTEYTWEIRNSDIINLCKSCNGRYSHEKDLPEICKLNFSKRQIDILFNSLMDGDGHRHKKGHKVYYTSSLKLAESLTTILTMSGYNAQLYGIKTPYDYTPTPGYERKDGSITVKYQVFVSKQNRQYQYLSKEEERWTIREVTNEKIACFETKYHTLVTRNGYKFGFHGNSKNMMHCFRLMHMAKEIAEGKGILLERTWDHDFLMDVRNHKFEYEEIIEMLEQEKQAMNEAMEHSTIPDHIDPEEVNKILIQIRLEQLRNLDNQN